MSDIVSTIADDVEEYEQLCMMYDEEIQLEQDIYGKWSPACYCQHATELRKRYLDDLYSLRKKY